MGENNVSRWNIALGLTSAWTLTTMGVRGALGLEGGGVSSSVFCVETGRSILLNTSAHWGPTSLALLTLLKEAEKIVLTSLKELYMERKELSPSLKEHKAEVRVNPPYFERNC